MTNLLKNFEDCNTLETKRYLLREIHMNKETCVNLKHNHAVTHMANTGYWQTYITLDSGKRKLIRKKRRDDLYDALCDFYFPAPKTSTMQALYPIWLKHKEKVTPSSNSIYRIDKDWIRFFLNDPISAEMIAKDIASLKKNDIYEWMVYLIQTYKMKKKGYNNMSIIPRSIFAYAYDNDMLDTNNFTKVKIPSYLFERDNKPDSSTQVFTNDEQLRLCKIALEEYYIKKNVYLLNVPLVFFTGLRVGELIALKWSDITADEISVSRSVKRDLVRTEDGWLPATYNVHDSLKKNAPPRQFPITSNTKELLNLIKLHYTERGENPTYVFEKEGRLAVASTLNSMWNRLCIYIDILPRSPHKGRKTLVTTLIDNQLPLHYICEIIGHEDAKTTYESYYFNRHEKEELKKKTEQALDLNLAL